MNQIILSSSKATWQAPNPHGSKNWNKNIHSLISKRYKHTCQYCGWVDQEFNEVHHIDENHENMNENNLTLACPLCHQCFHLGHASLSLGGKIIWVKDITQAEVNHIARMSWILETEPNHPMLPNVRNLMLSFENQTQLMENNYATNASELYFWDELLMKLTPEQYNERKDLLKNIVLLPNFHKFRRMVKPWKDLIAVNMPLSGWGNMIKGGKK